MEIDRMQASDEFRLGELLALLWDSKLVVAGATIALLVLGGVAYVMTPSSFVSRASVFPLSQSQFAEYLDLAHEKMTFQDNRTTDPLKDGAFPYTPAALHAEFSSNLRDFDKLAALAVKAGVVDRGTASDDAYNQRIRDFVSSIKFETSKTSNVEENQPVLNITAKAGDQDKLRAFMQQALITANTDAARGVIEEVRKRAAEIKSRLDAETVKLQLDIDARRQRAENDRNDEMIRVAEQSEIARSLGIQNPLDLRAIEAIEQRGTAPVQINSGGVQPPYLQGYAALDKRIEILRQRSDSDPFIPDLRELQQQIYVAKNNPRPARILALLKQSPLADPFTAMLVRFSTTSVTAEKVSPKLSVFGGVSLLLGLLLGAMIAFLRGEMTKRVQARASTGVGPSARLYFKQG